jgi:dTDP-glucose 4,6-dehydratase
MKLVVVTGCLGFIGTYVTRRCLERGWKVLGIDKCTHVSNLSLLEEFKKDENFSFLKKDIADLNGLPDCDYIINLAAESHVGNSIINSDEFLSSNILGVKKILEIIRQKPANIGDRPKLIHFSTDEVYGDIVSGEHKETDLLHPSNPYSAAKASADMLILAWARTYGIIHNILRPTNNYGKYQYHEKLIPLSVRCLQRNKKIRLHDEGNPIRTWLHAADTANAVMTIIDKGESNEIYNISGGFEQQNKDTVRKIVENYFDDSVRWTDYVDLGYRREGQDVRYSVDDSKIRNLGWKPLKVFDDEIKDIVSHYKNIFRW